MTDLDREPRIAQAVGARDVPADCPTDLQAEIGRCGSHGCKEVRPEPCLAWDRKWPMNWHREIAFAWWQVTLLMLSMASLGLAVGSTWPDVFVSWHALLWALFVVPGFYLSHIWLKQL